MFLLFYTLYYALFDGRWIGMWSYSGVSQALKGITNQTGTLLTSIFNNVSTPMTDLGDSLFSVLTVTLPYGTYNDISTVYSVVAFVLALITSIGIVVMAVKGIKRAFNVFFMLYR